MYIFPLGTYTTVFQAEVYAICACAKTLLMESEASIAIRSDSQAMLIALRSSKITSSLVAETIKALKELSMFNSVRLLLAFTNAFNQFNNPPVNPKCSNLLTHRLCGTVSNAFL